MQKSSREEVIELVNKLFIYTDYQRWNDLLKEVFYEDVYFDMSTLGGGAPTSMKASAICDAWRTGFAGIDSIHHQAGNYLVNFVESSRVEIYCYAIASHFKQSATEGKTREFVGSYDIGARMTKNGWRIDHFKYNLKYIDGNTALK